MKTQEEANLDRLLHQTLSKWLVHDRHLPPRFGEQVWRRIERIESHASATLHTQFAAALSNALARPSLALSYLTLLLLAGLLAGSLQARVERAQKAETNCTR